MTKDTAIATLLVMLAACTIPPEAIAQLTAQRGDSLRVEFVPTGLDETVTWSGTLESMSGDSLVLRMHSEDRTVHVPKSAINRVERPSGVRHAWPEGLLIGAIAGAGITYAAVKISEEPCDDRRGIDGLSCADIIPAAAPAFIFGAPIGGLLGAVFGNQVLLKTWEPVDLPDRLSIRVRPSGLTRPGLQIRLTLR